MMPYNNGGTMPMPYPQPYSNAFMPQSYTPYQAQGYGQQYPQTSQAPQPEFHDHINWCQGIEGAKAFYVPAGRSAQIMDSEGPYFYIKTVDNSGHPAPLRIFRYSEEYVQQNAQASAPSADYVTRREYDALASEVRSLRREREGGNENA